MRPIPFIATLIFTLAVGGAAGGLIGSLTSEGDGAAQPEAAGPADVLAALQSGDTERLREIQNQFGAAGAGAGAAVPEDGGQTAPPPSETTAPPGTGEAETLNGVLRSVSENAIVIAGADGVDTEVALAEGATALSFVAGGAGDLEVGQEAVLFGQPGEGGVTARFLLAAPAGSGVLDNFAAGAPPGVRSGPRRGSGAAKGTGRQGAAGQGGFGGGFAANLLVGPITAVDGNTVTIETERGPVSAAIDPEGTLLQVLTETPITDLTPGGQVIVTVGADGSAESIVAAPNLQSLLGGLFGGGQGGRGFGG